MNSRVTHIWMWTAAKSGWGFCYGQDHPRILNPQNIHQFENPVQSKAVFARRTMEHPSEQTQLFWGWRIFRNMALQTLLIINAKKESAKEEDRVRKVGERIYLKRKLPTRCELLLPGKMDLVTSLDCDQRVTKKDCARCVWSYNSY